MRNALLATVATVGLVISSGAVSAQENLKIGVTATLTGFLASGGEDSVRGLQVALKEAGGKIAGARAC